MVIYMVRKNVDMTEGRGPMVDVEAFTSEQDAWAFADLHEGVMGRTPIHGTWRDNRSGGDWEVIPIQVRETIGEVVQEREEMIRRTALSKLTREERKVLKLEE